MRRRRTIVGTALALTALSTGSALAVSDGNYRPAEQGCTGDADNSDHPSRVEPGCYGATVSLRDGSGHEYVVVGIPQTADGRTADSLKVCLDPGAGRRSCAVFDPAGVRPLPGSAGTAARPATGLHVYFGADDNLDAGEHDSSEQVSNGPSDGGAVALNVAPRSIMAWARAAMSRDRGYLLTHPLPLADGGAGACADGICISVQTQRRVAYAGGEKSSRDVADYGTARFDPDTCAGPTDTPRDCGGHPLSYYDKHNGTTYTEPGIQIYEDPDPQGSPAGPAYPIPAIYVGSCGLVVGGGTVDGRAVAAPPSPYTNSAGQLVVHTGCPS